MTRRTGVSQVMGAIELSRTLPEHVLNFTSPPEMRTSSTEFAGLPCVHRELLLCQSVGRRVEPSVCLPLSLSRSLSLSLPITLSPSPSLPACPIYVCTAIPTVHSTRSEFGYRVTSLTRNRLPP